MTTETTTLEGSIEAWNSIHPSEQWDSRLPVGPYTLEQPIVGEGQSLEQVADLLLGRNLEQVKTEADETLIPVTNTATSRQNPRIILTSGSEQINARDIEMHTFMMEGREKAVGIDPAIITREAYMARPGDIVVGRSEPWRQAVEKRRDTEDGLDIEVIDIGNEEYYYTSEVLLKLAIDYDRNPTEDNPIAGLIGQIQDEPETSIRLYTLDKQMQVFLLWLKERSGKSTLNVEANTPEASEKWNHKKILYPTLEEAKGIDNIDGPWEMLAEEDKLSPLGKLIELSQGDEVNNGIERRFPRVPGYTVERLPDESVEEFQVRIRQAADLMYDRYEIDKYCVKVAHSADGAGVHHSLKTNGEIDEDKKEKDFATIVNEEIGDHVRSVVVEAHTDYIPLQIEYEFNGEKRIYEIPFTISNHLENGEGRNDMTIQFVEGNTWRGNATFSLDQIESFITSEGDQLMLNQAHRFIRSLANSFGILATTESAEVADQNPRMAQIVSELTNGVSKGGFDSGIGTVGGKFGDTPMLFVQDPNVRSTGAETAYAMKEKHPGEEIAAWVIEPDADAVDDIIELADEYGIGVIACVPPGWGQVYAHDGDPLTAICKILEFKDILAERKLAA